MMRVRAAIAYLIAASLAGCDAGSDLVATNQVAQPPRVDDTRDLCVAMLEQKLGPQSPEALAKFLATEVDGEQRLTWGPSAGLTAPDGTRVHAACRDTLTGAHRPEFAADPAP